MCDPEPVTTFGPARPITGMTLLFTYRKKIGLELLHLALCLNLEAKGM
jgi:hypothetical protein